MKRLEFRAMGCETLALLDGAASLASDPLAAVPGWFAGWEQSLSRFRDDSELNHLNRNQGRWTVVSPTLWEAVDVALQAAQQSDGLVTPTILEALEAAGYLRSFDLLAQAAPTKTPLTATTMVAPSPIRSWRGIDRDHSLRALRLARGLRLDLGGSAKGWAAGRAAHLLSSYGPALVDAGGDIAISGPLLDGSPWLIGVADPRQPDQDLEMLALKSGGVATSGRDYRRWMHDGIWRHHILDPRTGLPAETDALSVTVVAPTVCEAEVAAKVAVILGSDEGLSWIEARPALAGLIIREDGKVAHSRRLREYIAS